jgi:RimJ/RimL family protein N-acetyltransferase
MLGDNCPLSASHRYNEKCGYHVEGVLKNQIFRNGKYHDEILMAIFREDWLNMQQE